MNMARTVEVSLTVDPTHAIFSTAGGTSTHTLINTGMRRLAVKMRCSHNALYRMSPVMCFIDSGQVQNLVVTRLPGEARIDKVLVQYTEASPGDQDVKAKFGPGIRQDKIDNVRIMLRVSGSSHEMLHSSE